MDSSAQQPLSPQPQVVQPTAPVTPQAQAPVVSVSNQPLTLDPNMLSTPMPQASVAQPVAQPVQPQVPPQTVAPIQPIQSPQYPVSGPHKEAAPIMQAPVSEYVRPTEVAPQLQPEVREAGVEVVTNPEQPQLTQEHKAVGLEPAKEAVPVVIPTQPTIQLPYTAQQAKEIEKKVPVAESRHWLAVLTEYLLKKLQGVTA